MEKYIGIKVVEAEVMTDHEAFKLGYLRLGNDDKLGAEPREGYHVHYIDNDYDSWCPKNVFEQNNTLLKNTVLANTLKPMMSADYKERFLAEYYQLKNRYDNLCRMLSNWDKGALTFEPTCPREIYTLQIKGMKKYLDALVIRARLEDIQLS